MRYLLLLILLLPTLAFAQRVGSPVPFTIGVTETFHSKALGEDRILHIHLPPGYTADTVAAYPVIYLLDGGAGEDFLHVVGGLQFASYEWIQWMPPSIVVGIANMDRKRDFTHPTTIAADKEQFPTTGGSVAFQQFLRNELIPFINGNYRAGGPRTLIGQSLGGLFATEVLFRTPYLFQHYIIVSPSLWWDNGSVLDIPTDALMAPDIGVISIYVAVGKEGRVMVRGAKRLAALVRKNGTARVGFEQLTEMDHADILHQAVMDAFRWRSEK
jgi:uncharacterized protein